MNRHQWVQAIETFLEITFFNLKQEYSMNTIQKTAIAAAISGLFAPAVFAQAAPAPEASPVTANVTVVSDYRFRGVSQSNFKPAIQGGFDYAHESGFYIGNWNSSISWLSDAVPGSSAPIEINFYGGIKKELIAPGFVSDFGVLQYAYPTTGYTTTNPNTTELYAAQNFTAGALAGFVKFSYAVTNAFGTADSTGSYYPDLTVNYDTGILGISLNAHVGYQYIAGKQSGTSNSSLYSFTDWKIGLTKDFGGGLSGAIAYIDTNAKKVGGVYSYKNPQGKNTGGATGLVSLTKTF
jgi:uncharacterized protein (TIGR02001 family)